MVSEAFGNNAVEDAMSFAPITKSLIDSGGAKCDPAGHPRFPFKLRFG
jgi:hypothetical protein